LAGKIQKIDLNLCFDRKNLDNWFEFVDKKNPAVLTGKFKQIDFNLCFVKRNQSGQCLQVPFICFFNSNLHFDRKNPENWYKFVFWQVKSNKSIWICVKGPFKESYQRNIDQNWVIISFRVNLFWNLKKKKKLFL
jgi:hypothetical protein